MSMKLAKAIDEKRFAKLRQEADDIAKIEADDLRRERARRHWVDVLSPELETAILSANETFAEKSASLRYRWSANPQAGGSIAFGKLYLEPVAANGAGQLPIGMWDLIVSYDCRVTFVGTGGNSPCPFADIGNWDEILSRLYGRISA